ncbi:MAG: peroxide stress protein YaaA [Magnetococcales bacterium]|nr:peroxide stress protein YaaA [Magnetococcales bacterium]
MLALISPAKTLDTSPSLLGLAGTQPDFGADALQLVHQLKQLSEAELAALLHISPALARLNSERFRAFSADPVAPAAQCAALMYRGDTYQGLDVDSWGGGDWDTAQQSLRILSGLYGVLRPLDLIQPYRLEMATRLANTRGKDLYAFWGKRLSEHITALAGHRTVINLASEEYTRVVKEVPMVTPVFKEQRQGRMQVIGLLAKRARGAMARFMITNRLTEPESLQQFTEGGYVFRQELSDPTHWLFVQDHVSEK